MSTRVFVGAKGEKMKRLQRFWCIAMLWALTVIASGSAHAKPFDQAFIDAMVPHHMMASQMAQLAVTKAKHSQLRQMARMIIRDQNREIAQMKAWRKAWYGSGQIPMTHMMHNGDVMMSHGSMMGLPMRMKMDMGKLRAAKGDAFDKMFIEMMIPHHAGALMMAREALDTTARPQIRSLSHNIIDKQAQEIGTLHTWHRRWFGKM
jgi:uncharacterized protein (DUF305 family)